MKQAVFAAGLFAAMHAASAAEDRVELGETTILGNRELPRVTYVVPWRDVTVNVPEWPLARTVDEPLAPVDREVLRRELDLYQKRRAGKE